MLFHGGRCRSRSVTKPGSCSESKCQQVEVHGNKYCYEPGNGAESDPPAPPRQARGKCPPGSGLQDHHLLPLQFANWFNNRNGSGCKVEDPGNHACCPANVHGDIHWEKQWNAWWQDFIDKNPNASCSQVLNYLHSLMQGYFKDEYGKCTSLPGGAGGLLPVAMSVRLLSIFALVGRNPNGFWHHGTELLHT